MLTVKILLSLIQIIRDVMYGLLFFFCFEIHKVFLLGRTGVELMFDNFFFLLQRMNIFLVNPNIMSV
jgi:hypothetical protein